MAALYESAGCELFINPHKMKRIVFLLVFFCLALSGGLPVACAGAPPRPNPITAYNPYTGQTEPFYPYGWYIDDEDVNHASFDKIGGNTLIVAVYSYDRVRQILDIVRSHDKKIIIAFRSPSYLLGVDPCDSNTYGGMKYYTDFAKNDPALLGWLLGDENEWNFIGTAQEIVNSAYVLNNILDGHHQVWQIFSGFDVQRALPYLDGTTVYSMDAYPYHISWGEPNSFINVEWWQDCLYAMGQKAVEDGKSSALLPQGFGNIDTEPIMVDWRLPTRREHRWQVFSAIAATGSRGTINWLYNPEWYDANAPAFDNWLENVAKPVFAEQEMISHGMETGYNIGSVAVDWTNKASDQSGGWVRPYDRVTQLLIYDDSVGRYFLIVTNNGPLSQNAQFTISNLSSSLSDMNSLVYDDANTGRTVAMTNSGGGSYRLTDTLQEFATVIYRINANPVNCMQARARQGGIAGDLNGDCYMNFADFAVFAQDWAHCVDTQGLNCL